MAMRRLAWVGAWTLLLGTGASARAHSAEPGPSARPIVLELYTSEGCSSCPPAEALIGELSRNPALLPLALHVDYWDSLGWRDRFALPASAQRQRRWADTHGRADVFTPQMIVDGRASVLGSDRGAIDAAVRAARTALDSLPHFDIDARLVDGVVHIAIPEPADHGRNEVLAVAYLPQTVTAVPRGENAGRTIDEWNVVRAVRPLGSIDGAPLQRQIALGELPADAGRLAILVQDAVSGQVRAVRVLTLR